MDQRKHIFHLRLSEATISSCLAWSLVSLALTVALCTIMSPWVALSEAGASNFAVHWPTAPLYSLGLVISAVCDWSAADLIPDDAHRLRNLRLALYGLGILILLVLLSTYPFKVNHSLNDLHKLTAFALMIYELVLNIYLTISLNHRQLVMVLLVSQIATSVLLVMTLYGLKLLFLGQVLAALSGGLLLVVATRDLTPVESSS